MTDAQPLSELLDTFWEGEFTLRPASPDSAAGASSDSALAGLGPAGIRIVGRDLAALLAPAYRRLTGSAD
ncbi:MULTISPECIES: hypothetical protein [Kitasatospora]|uniref:GNAT family N-acetyltransferase n=1 Tax=Kitasatospora cystarginea TaxID=58350 RepID=A0ABN3DIH4_9ACTN